MKCVHGWQIVFHSEGPATTECPTECSKSLIEVSSKDSDRLAFGWTVGEIDRYNEKHDTWPEIKNEVGQSFFLRPTNA